MKTLIISAIFIIACTYLMCWTQQSENDSIIIISVYGISFLVFVLSAVKMLKKETRD